jgi:DNA-binding NtrC family response regulator
MLQIRDTIASVAPTDSAVLIEGESGTGKGVAAAAIHRSSARSNGPFVTVNCGAIPPDLLESEIFGHQKGGGATTDSRGFLRAAHAGTLFLTEVDQLPSELQPRLLRALQEKEVHPVGGTQGYDVDVRIIASTKESLVAAVQAGKFRQDLLLWLSASRIELPPLRQIKDDMGPLVLHFIRRFNRDFGRHVASVAPDAMAALMTYDFPGNVRELENIIERAYALGARDEIKFADLPSLILERRGPADANAVFPSQSLDEFERELIVATLRTYDNNKEKVAQALGMSERTLYRRLKKLGV